MPTPQRLPIVNADDAVWGDILRQYLMKEHYNDDTNNAANGGHHKITVRAGTATAGTAPLKFTSGALLTTPEAGAVEFNTDSVYFTITTGTVRKKVALYDDSSGATGDVYYRDSSGNFVRLGVGSNGNVLKVAGGLPVWGAPSAVNTTTTSAVDYSISGTDVVIFADASSNNVDVGLPDATTCAGYKFDIKRIDGNTGNQVQIYTNNSEAIDNGGSAFLKIPLQAVTLVSNGINWYIL